MKVIPFLLAAALLFAANAAGFAQEVLPEIARRFAPDAVPSEETPNFQRHVVPLLGRLGCSGRNCHGSFQGRGGFRLSMFGYDFAADHAALTTGKRPRVDRDDPAESLLLTKPTETVNHGGKKRFERGGWEYRVLERWIRGGAVNDAVRAGKLVRLDVEPRELSFARPGQTVQLRAVAAWSDGTREDVTCLTRFASNDDGVAEVAPSGKVTATGRGATYVIATYDNQVQSNLVVLPVSGQAGEHYPPQAAPSVIDETIVAHLRKLGIVPSGRCSDEEFLRRVMLDVIGTLPTPDEIRSFLADPSKGKRRRKIDELLDRPEYAAWWTTFLCDLTGLNAPLFLGNTEWAKVTGEQWQQWLHRRVQGNVGYDKIARGLILAVSRDQEQTYEEYALARSQYTRKKAPLDFSERELMDHFWHRGNVGQPEEKALSFAHVFLGVRLDCAQCHKHPFDQWSQEDFKRFAAFFVRLQRGTAPDAREAFDRLQKSLGNSEKLPAAERRALYRKVSEQGEPAPWREVYVNPVGAPIPLQAKLDKDLLRLEPRILGGDIVTPQNGEHSLQPLMDWLLRRDNPYFARAFVNRVWAHYFGRGIVDPPDDFTLGNPPSNKELLDALALGFVDHGYDLKWLHRAICNSDAYQRSWTPNESNADDEKHFSRARVRRLYAEVALDALTQASLGTKARAAWTRKIADRRIAQQPTADHKRTEFGLVVFGKPLRITNCDCERQMDPSLLQALYLRNDKDLLTLLDRKDGWLQEIPAQGDVDGLIREAYLRTLSRPPDAAELRRSREHVESADGLRAGIRDVVWALVNTREFITNH